MKKRLRKKLHRGEFARWYCDVTITWKPGTDLDVATNMVVEVAEAFQSRVFGPLDDLMIVNDHSRPDWAFKLAIHFCTWISYDDRVENITLGWPRHFDYDTSAPHGWFDAMTRRLLLFLSSLEPAAEGQHA